MRPKNFITVIIIIIIDRKRQEKGLWIYPNLEKWNISFYFFLRGHGNESCNLIGSLPGQYFPISAHGPGHGNAFMSRQVHPNFRCHFSQTYLVFPAGQYF